MRYMIAAILACLPTLAFAQGSIDLICAPIPTAPVKAMEDPLVSVRVKREGTFWQIRFDSLGGKVFRREDQYDINDASSQGEAGWQGRLKRSPNIRAHGFIEWAAGSLRYNEIISDDKEGGVSIATTTSLCARWQDHPTSAEFMTVPQDATPLPPQPAGLTPVVASTPEPAVPANVDQPLPADSLTVSREGVPGNLLQIIITSKVDDIDIDNVTYNRGNCRPSQIRSFPIHLKFGQKFVGQYFYPCVPIEVRVSTSLGWDIFTFTE